MRDYDYFVSGRLSPQSAWSEQIFTLPVLNYTEYLNCAFELLDRHVIDRRGGAIALENQCGQISYTQLLELVNRIAHVLTEDLALHPGQRVLLRGANTFMMAASILAVWKIGGIAVPTMPLLRAHELGILLRKAKVNAVLCCASLSQEMEVALASYEYPIHCLHFNSVGRHSLEAYMSNKSTSFNAYESRAEDVCLIAFSSGTTSIPKACAHFHRDILAIGDCFPKTILNARFSDIFLGTAPMGFTYGLGASLIFPMRVGACSVLIEENTPEALFFALKKYKISIFFSVPRLFRTLATCMKPVPYLRHCISAGETLSSNIRVAWQAAVGKPIIDGLGSTEMLHIFIASPPEEIRKGSVGQVIPGYQAIIVDNEGEILPPGDLGWLAVKGPTACRYLEDSRQYDVVKGGWMLTGDACTMDEDGFFYCYGRMDEIIITSGYNVDGREVEDCLLSHNAVAECAVTALPDPERGQIVQAHVRLREGFFPSQDLVKILQAYVKFRLAPYKYPRLIHFIDFIPKTPSGKIQRFKLA